MDIHIHIRMHDIAFTRIYVCIDHFCMSPIMTIRDLDWDFGGVSMTKRPKTIIRLSKTK